MARSLGYGGGGNGKSVFLNTVSRILGAYHATAPMETFTASSGERHPTDLAMLRGARLVARVKRKKAELGLKPRSRA
jgi:phage/plasmid-associated DNA primase